MVLVTVLGLVGWQILASLNRFWKYAKEVLNSLEELSLLFLNMMGNHLLFIGESEVVPNKQRSEQQANHNKI